MKRTSVFENNEDVSMGVKSGLMGWCDGSYAEMIVRQLCFLTSCLFFLRVLTPWGTKSRKMQPKLKQLGV